MDIRSGKAERGDALAGAEPAGFSIPRFRHQEHQLKEGMNHLLLQKALPQKRKHYLALHFEHHFSAQIVPSMLILSFYPIC